MKNESIYQKIYEMLVSANEKFNLTRITDYDDFITKHVKDSLLALPLIEGKVLDVGSGAGFLSISAGGLFLRAGSLLCYLGRSRKICQRGAV